MCPRLKYLTLTMQLQLKSLHVSVVIDQDMGPSLTFSYYNLILMLYSLHLSGVEISKTIIFSNIPSLDAFKSCWLSQPRNYAQMPSILGVPFSNFNHRQLDVKLGKSVSHLIFSCQHSSTWHATTATPPSIIAIIGAKTGAILIFCNWQDLKALRHYAPASFIIGNFRAIAYNNDSDIKKFSLDLESSCIIWPFLRWSLTPTAYKLIKKINTSKLRHLAATFDVSKWVIISGQ